MFRKGSNGNGGGGADSVRSALKNKDFYVPVAVGLGGALAVVTGPPVVRGVSSAVESVKELKLDPSGIFEKVGSNMGFGKAGQSGSTGSGQKAGGKKRQSSSASRSSGGGSNGQKRSSARRGSAKRARSSSASGSKPKS